ncbi:hypothetical protein [Microlunatus sp. Y2014]|uniref:hypothetical protein n=1 Tax=Microlunatus sp. Y2014 TaxID=3418488 RepID=UPI003DA7687C
MAAAIATGCQVSTSSTPMTGTAINASPASSDSRLPRLRPSFLIMVTPLASRKPISTTELSGSRPRTTESRTAPIGLIQVSSSPAANSPNQTVASNSTPLRNRRRSTRTERRSSRKPTSASTRLMATIQPEIG